MKIVVVHKEITLCKQATWK